MPASVVDLFCGVGGMTHGFLQEGFDVRAGVDLDLSCKYAYEKNNRGAKFLHADVAGLDASDLEPLFSRGAIRVLIGCAPCQPFSLYTNSSTRDPNWQLLPTFAKLIVELRPDIVSMENVPRLERDPVFNEFVEALEGAGYAVSHFFARGPEFGIPQRRVRLVLFASQLGPIALVEPTHPGRKGTTVREAIGHLPALKAGGVDARDPLHRARALAEINIQRLKATPEGGFWRDWPDSLKLDCHQKDTGTSFKSVYGRMWWDRPASVITTQCIGLGNGRFGHPEQDRAISLREAAILQSFPKNYAFIDPDQRRFSAAAIARQIGNAVPVRLGRMVARSIRRHIGENNAA